MKKIGFMILLSIALLGEWRIYGSNPTLMYNSESGEVFRYFEQDGIAGFMKLNFHKNFTLKESPNVVKTTPSTLQDNAIDVKKLQQTLMNNSLNEVLK